MVVYREVSGVGITAQTVSEGVKIIVCSAETKNKTQQNKKPKQTNNNTHNLDQQYLSQIKPDIYETFRKSYCGHPKTTQTKKLKIAFELTISLPN